MIYILSVCISFIAIFLKGLQYKNINGSHYRAAFITSCLMMCFEVVTITLVIKGGWSIALSAGLGVAFGVVASMFVHDKLFKKG